MCYDRQICISALGHLVAQIDFQLGLFLRLTLYITENQEILFLQDT